MKATGAQGTVCEESFGSSSIARLKFCKNTEEGGISSAGKERASLVQGISQGGVIFKWAFQEE